ncbi:MAG: hypothetical protein AAGA48_12910 [Myxococcota bacterium]
MIGLTWWLLGCGSEAPPPVEPEPAPEPVVARAEPPAVPKVPYVQWSLPSRKGKTPNPLGRTDKNLKKQLGIVRARLVKLVRERGRNPLSPWAVAHAMLALGPELTLQGVNRPAIDYLAEEYGRRTRVGRDELWRFPPKVGNQLVDVHTDLLLKAFTEGGLSPDRAVVVAGEPTTLGELYRNSLHRAWVDGRRTGFQERGFNDAPWALQALSAWAPKDLSWTAQGGHEMTLQDFTRALRNVIASETAEMKAARNAGASMKKDTRKGFFKYTCGGQHMLQGLTYAVARGFGDEADKTEVCDQIELLTWRIDVELNAIDPLIRQGTPQIQLLLLVQRLKFLGHTLETVHKAAAMGVCSLTSEQVAASERVARELVLTVDGLNRLGAFDNLDRIAVDRGFERLRKGGGSQILLDMIGDSAHAIRGIDMATGKGSILY